MNRQIYKVKNIETNPIKPFHNKIKIKPEDHKITNTAHKKFIQTFHNNIRVFTA